MHLFESRSLNQNPEPMADMCATDMRDIKGPRLTWKHTDMKQRVPCQRCSPAAKRNEESWVRPPANTLLRCEGVEVFWS